MYTPAIICNYHNLVSKNIAKKNSCVEYKQQWIHRKLTFLILVMCELWNRNIILCVRFFYTWDLRKTFLMTFLYEKEVLTKGQVYGKREWLNGCLTLFEVCSWIPRYWGLDLVVCQPGAVPVTVLAWQRCITPVSRIPAYDVCGLHNYFLLSLYTATSIADKLNVSTHLWRNCQGPTSSSVTNKSCYRYITCFNVLVQQVLFYDHYAVGHSFPVRMD